jgi:hypothetical protein
LAQIKFAAGYWMLVKNAVEKDKKSLDKGVCNPHNKKG